MDLLNKFSQLVKHYWYAAMRASPEKPLNTVAIDCEIINLATQNRHKLETCTHNDGVAAFQTSCVVSSHTDEGERVTRLRVDIVAVDLNAPEPWKDEISQLEEGNQQNRATNGVTNMLRGLKRLGGESYADMLRRIARETPAALHEIATLSPEAVEKGYVLVVAPGRQFFMAMQVLNTFAERLEYAHRSRTFFLTSTNTGKPNDKVLAFASACDIMAMGRNMAGVNNLSGFDAFKAAAPLLAARHIALKSPLTAMFPKYYDVAGSAIMVQHGAMAKALGAEFEEATTELYDLDASSTKFGEHAAQNPVLARLLRSHPTPTKLRDFLVRNPEIFNKMLHNARPDTVEIQDIVGYHIFLQRKVGERVDAMETDTEEDS